MVAAEPISLQAEAQRDFEATDAKLRAAYDDLIADLDVGQRRELETVQDLWLKFREPAAKSTATLSGKTEIHEQLLETLERRKLTEERLQALERLRESRDVAILPISR